MTALANGTYTISSLVGNHIFYLRFQDSAPGSRLRGRLYFGDKSQHWIIRTLSNQYTILNARYGMHVTGSSSPPQMATHNANRTSVWNIAGGTTVVHANIVLYDYQEFAEIELWNIVPLGSHTKSEGAGTVTIFKPLTRVPSRRSTSESTSPSPTSPPADTASNETRYQWGTLLSAGPETKDRPQRHDCNFTLRYCYGIRGLSTALEW
ncbi:hypothetical protein CC2G_014410 [Coprinopsis cinerea AmutBmut pab1-1]|nr:hypothetical protein CC2G_014410 [Coprinopsis cinerea AmutBmut pab1-1]